MNRLPIRWRFTLLFGSTLAAVLIAFTLVLLLVMRHQYLASVDNELSEELREITSEIAWAKTAPEMVAQLTRRFAEHGDFHFELRRPSGEMLFQSRALEGRKPLETAAALSVGNLVFDNREIPEVGHSRVVFTMVEGPGGPYAVGAATSLEAFDRQMSVLMTVLVASVPVALGLALLGGYTLARRVLSPVDRIVEVANRITASDLNQRVEAMNSRDELGRLAQTINSLIDRLQKAIEEMRRFTADAAHELRTPLAVLRSGIEVTLRAPRSAEEYRKALEAAADESHRLARVADQLLFLTRQEAGMAQIEREEVRLDALLKDVVDHFAVPAREAGLTLAVEPIEPCSVRGDDIRLSQVFFNALDNAVKYTPQGGRITVRARPAGKRVRVEVEDTGIGIASEHLANVFKRFYRADPQPSGPRAGAGLGLAIAKSAVVAHGGDIWLESQVGHGTVLRVELPLMESTSSSDEPSATRGASSAQRT
jgi:two-component system, OmpR family, heavy metal sensor histidine kinase CusS